MLKDISEECKEDYCLTLILIFQVGNRIPGVCFLTIENTINLHFPLDVFL